MASVFCFHFGFLIDFLHFFLFRTYISDLLSLLQPQFICGEADLERKKSVYRYGDMVMPFCYGPFMEEWAGEWLRQ
jgi:hypothetical protein